jgi:thiol-disulfide isomerase/thioredoxin
MTQTFREPSSYPAQGVAFVSKMKRTLFTRSGILVATILFFQSISTAYGQPKIGNLAPDIRLPDTSGALVSLADLKGKVVLIDFWASWCVPCRQFNPSLRKIYGANKTKGFEIYGISIDKSAAAWKKAIHADGISWLQVNDNAGWDASVTMDWKVDYIPTSFLLNKEGRVVAVNPNQRKLKSYLKKHLK